MSNIYNEFNEIRKIKRKASFGEQIVIGVCLAFVLISYVTLIVEDFQNFIVSFACFTLSLYVMIIVANNESEMDYDDSDLDKIKFLLNKYEYDDENKRYWFKQVIADSLSYKPERICGIDLIVNFILLPVYNCIVDKILDGENVVFFGNNNFVIDQGIVLLILFFFVGIAIYNIVCIYRQKHDSIKKDFILAIDKVQLKEKMHTTS